MFTPSRLIAMLSVCRVLALAGLILVVLALVPFSATEAKDWELGDRGTCPGTWEGGKCNRPYLCEPTRCYGCYSTTGNKCAHCGQFGYPECAIKTKPREDVLKDPCPPKCKVTPPVIKKQLQIQR
jgi:hypothetical protein